MSPDKEVRAIFPKGAAELGMHNPKGKLSFGGWLKISTPRRPVAFQHVQHEIKWISKKLIGYRKPPITIEHRRCGGDALQFYNFSMMPGRI